MALLTSPYMSVSDIVNEGGREYALGVRLRYSYVADDLSEGDNFYVVLFDCQNEDPLFLMPQRMWMWLRTIIR